MARSEKSFSDRCEYHGLYWYANGLTINGEMEYTCKLGCIKVGE